jgi:ribosomal protein S18 acetylase RimI-like enzyme
MLIVRLYEPRDRTAVRQICCDTADAGQPVENFFPDREFIADLVTRYYTDYESESCWVAEAAGRVIGYLTGSVRGRRAECLTAWRIAPVAILRAIGRGVLFHRQTWRMLRAGWRTLRLRQGGRADVDYRAHVHINLAAGWRGQQTGRQLMEQFFRYATAAGVGGVIAGVRGDNAGGRKFFERLGFMVVARQPLVLPSTVTETIVYEKTL